MNILCLFYIPPKVIMFTVSFLAGLCALLGDVEVSFSDHMFHLAWVEARFEYLAVHYIEERSIGAPTALASAPTRALSAALNCWYTSPVDPTFLVLVVLCNSKGFSNLGCHVGHSAKSIPKLVVLDLSLCQAWFSDYSELGSHQSAVALYSPVLLGFNTSVLL